jgi:HK97 family phage portal protein
MGLGRLLSRSTQYVATNTVTGATETFTVVDNLAPDWATDDYRGGMGIPGAWRASVLLSDLLGSVPWHAYRSRPGRALEMLDPTPLLLEQPNPPETRMNTFSGWALDLIWEGNAVGLVASRDAQGWPTSAVAVPANMMGVRRVTEGMNSLLPIGTIEYTLGGRSFDSSEVIHIKGPCAPGMLRGMGVLEAHLNTITLAQEQNRQARSLSRHGVPTGLLKATSPDTTPEQMKAAKKAWLEAQRDRTIAALGPTTDFEPLAWNPEELQLVEARRFTLTEWELIFGLPPGWLGGMNSARQYSNIEQDAVNLLKFSLGGHLARFEQTFSLAMPRDRVAKANLDAVLRSDTLTRYQAHEIGIRSGFLLDDEAREYEHRAPLTAAQRASRQPPAAPPAITPPGQEQS